MFGFFKKNNLKKLQQQYQQKLEQAMQAQRNGDIRTYSVLSEEADALLKQIDGLKERSSNG